MSQGLQRKLEMTRNRMKQMADKKRTERTFMVGDWVHSRLKPYRQTIVALRRNMKLNPRYFVSYKVIRKIEKVSYKLLLPATTNIHLVFHVSLLKKKIGDNAVVSSIFPVTDESSKVKVSPIEILERRIIKKGDRAVAAGLIKWSNLFTEDATWEDLEELQLQFPESDIHSGGHFVWIIGVLGYA